MTKRKRTSKAKRDQQLEEFEKRDLGQDIRARFNDLVTERLLEGARDGLLRHGVDEASISVIWVPGAFELPSAAQHAAAGGRTPSTSRATSPRCRRASTRRAASKT